MNVSYSNAGVEGEREGEREEGGWRGRVERKDGEGGRQAGRQAG